MGRLQGKADVFGGESLGEPGTPPPDTSTTFSTGRSQSLRCIPTDTRDTIPGCIRLTGPRSMYRVTQQQVWFRLLRLRRIWARCS